MKILVLGASGFIGKNIAEHFSNLGHEVHRVGFTRAEYSYPDVIWHKVDLRNPDEVKNIVEGMDVIIHAAATTSGSKDIVNNPSIHVTDNAIMNSLIFRAACEAKVKHVIFFSCTVMYPTSFLPLKEDTFPGVDPKYFGVAHTKLYCEKMCEFYSKIEDTKFTAIRHSNIYGPHDKFDLERSHVFGATVTKVMTQDKIIVWGDGEEARDFLYVNDLCNFVERAIDKQPGKFGLYNCGSGIALPIKELVSKIISASGKNISIEYDLSAPTIKTSLSLDCTKAKEELDWESQTLLDEGIKKTISWWKENYK